MHPARSESARLFFVVFVSFLFFLCGAKLLEKRNQTSVEKARKATMFTESGSFESVDKNGLENSIDVGPLLVVLLLSA